MIANTNLLWWVSWDNARVQTTDRTVFPLEERKCFCCTVCSDFSCFSWPTKCSLCCEVPGWYQGKRLLASVRTDLAWFLNISVHISRCSCMFFTGIISYSHCVFGSCFVFYVWIPKLQWFNHTIFYCLILLLTVARLYCSAVFVTDWKLMHYNMLHAYTHI